MSEETRDGTGEPVSGDQVIRRERGQRKNIFPCPADYGQDWQPYPVDPYFAECADHTYTYFEEFSFPLICCPDIPGIC